MKAVEAKNIKNQALEKFHKTLEEQIDKVCKYIDKQIKYAAQQGRDNRSFAIEEILQCALDLKSFPTAYLKTINSQLFINEIGNIYTSNGFCVNKAANDMIKSSLYSDKFTIRW